METKNRIITIVLCSAAVIASWVILLSSKTPAQKQLDLINRAQSLSNVGIYILAVPLLEEAVTYNAPYTEQAEENLKSVYLSLIDNRGYARKYTNLLDSQMAREDAGADVFEEAANYYLRTNATQNALRMLRAGIARTEDERLTELYENVRYSYDTNRVAFEDVTAIFEQTQTIQVMQNGKWGIAKTDGSILIPCQYDKVSTFYQGRAIVKNRSFIYAVDSGNNRIAVTPEETWDFRNLSENRTALLLYDGWHRATPGFESGTSVFEDIGMYCGGYASAKTGGKWGVIDMGNGWLIPPEFDEIIQDELGRCYGQGSVFARSGNNVYLFTDGTRHDEVYQDARPFGTEGYAAVRRNDKWGFIDNEGNVVIDFIFDDALSFGGHLAAVKTGELWGYVNTSGRLVIRAEFIEAKSFSDGSAPVLTEKGWQIITLIEFKKERGLA